MSPTATPKKPRKGEAPKQQHSPTIRDRQNQTLGNVVRPSDVSSILQAALINGDFKSQAELFSRMEDSWPRLSKNLNEVKRAVSRLPFEVVPYSEDGAEPTPEALDRAAFVSKALWGMRPDPRAFEKQAEGLFYDLLDAFAKGISVVEILWEANERGIVPRAVRQLPAAYVGFPQTGYNTADRIMFDPTGCYGTSANLVEMPLENFVIAVSQARSGHPSSTALLRSLAKYWVAAQYGYQWLVNYAQLFGTPLRFATYDPANKGLLDDITAMLENIGSAGWGAFPAGSTLELKEPSQRAGENPQKLLMDVADKACDLLILGQTLTTDVSDSGSRALGDVHASIRGDILSSTADWLAGILNTQFIPTLLRLNYGDADEAPTFSPNIKAVEDAKVNAERDEILISKMGLPVLKSWLYERHGIPQPPADAEPEAIFTGKPAAPTDTSVIPPEPITARVAAVECDALVQARRAIERDRLADATMEKLSGVAADWLRPARPVFAKLIEKAQDKTVSDADFAAAVEAAAEAMPELFDKLDTPALARAMEEAMGAAAVNGAMEAAKLAARA